MNRIAFLRILRDGLAGLPAPEIDDILIDYAAYFDEAHASGRSDEEVATALGDPRRLARELRAESGLRRWENHRSLRNSVAALLALGGLAAVDILLLLPLLFGVTLLVLAIGLVIFVLGIVGLGAMLSLFKAAQFVSVGAMVLRAAAGIGLIAASMGCGALLLLALNGGVKMLGRFARLHYRLLKPEPKSASAPADQHSIGGAT
jgi:uncharacterized membrane protein